jgi:GNAT superfamily N-acetyltransferase
MVNKGGVLLGSDLKFRIATEQDLDRIVEMLADDVLGSKRERYERPLPDSYIKAFQAITADPNNELVVACLGDDIIGVQQITFTPYITHQGGWRATFEGVRTSSSERGKGLGTELIRWGIQRAKERGCHLVQLTTDKKREDALRFYESLGFKASHEGLKMQL